MSATRRQRPTSSTSRRRARAGASCSSRSACATSCCSPDADEDAEALEAERAGELPDAYVERVTRAKLRAARAAPARARRCRRRRSSAPTPPSRSAARILGKPADAADARAHAGAAVGPHAPRASPPSRWRRAAARALRASASRACASRRSRRRDIDALRRQRRAVRQGRRLCDPERAPRPGSSGSKAATPVSWVCRCTRRPRLLAAGAACESGLTSRSTDRRRCKTS